MKMTNLKKWLGIVFLSLGTLLPITTTNAHHKPKLEESIEQEERFKGLWSIIENHVNIPESYKHSLLKDDAELLFYIESNYPELLNAGDLSYSGLEDLCRKNNKICLDSMNLYDPEKEIIMTGDIIKDYKEKFKFRGQSLDYSVLVFEVDLDNKAAKEKEGIAWYMDSTKTAYINNTKITDIAEYLYDLGHISTSENEFSSFMMNELYLAIKENTKNKKEFIKKFDKAIINSTIKHERMHHFYLYGDDLIESRANEAETFLYQVSEDKKYNSWVFLITSDNPNNDKYERFYRLFEERKYDKERLMEITPKERAKIAKEIFEKYKF